MGTWGTALYSDDHAADLRAAVGAVCRLPLDGERIVELLAELHPQARDPADDEHTTFWLVVADQLHRRGISSTAQARALEIISTGTNLQILAKLGMDARGLKARERVLAALADKLRAPVAQKPRKTLKAPEVLLFAPGDVLAHPVDSQGNCPNPYFASAALGRFAPAGWSGCLVVATGRAFDYLAWYQIATSRGFWTQRPTLEEVAGRIDGSTADVGTLSKGHVVKMRLERLGTVPPPDLPPANPGRIRQVVSSDISAANLLSQWLPAGSVS